MASEEPAVCSFVDQTTWELLNLLDIVGRRNGRVLVMEVDNDNVRAPSVLLDFAQDLCGTADVGTKLQQAERMEEEEEVRPHLVFMLWQATVLKQLMRWEHLDEALWDLRSLVPCLPDVLVLVMIHPGPQEQLDQAVGALRRLQCLLDGAWQLVVEAAVYSPGQPGGILEAKRAACRALREVLNLETDTGAALCFPGWALWSGPGDLQDPEEEVALTSLSPNGNYEEAAGGTGT
uniref:Uncharacterized protein n=1 Tax=Accipiter nisus TaxID=211598 RepID=A0A8B9MDN7_9AVES